jgi:hypothetical protein
MSHVPEWLQWIDGGGTDIIRSVVADSAGNLYICGYSNTTGTSILFGGSGSTFTKPATTGGAAFIGKLDSSGIPQWLQWIDGVGTDENSYSVTTDFSGNVYVSGHSNTTGTSILFGSSGSTYTKPATTGEAVFIAKLNSSGVPQWLQWIDGTGTTEQGYSVVIDFSGNVYVGGFSNTSGTSIQFGNNSTYPKPATVGDAGFIAKLDSSGMPQWLQWIDGPTSGNDRIWSSAIDSSGNVYVCGYSDTTGTSILFSGTSYTKPSTTSQAVFIGKLNSSGILQWLQWIDGAGTTEQAWSVTTDFSGNVYVSGYSNTTGTSILFGSSGSTFTKPGTTGNAGFIGKLNSSGVPQWLQWIDGGGAEETRSVTTDFSGNVYVCGNSNTTGTSIRFGTSGTYAKPATTAIAVFVAKLDSSGVPQWLHWIDGTGSEETYSVATDSSGNVYVTGYSTTTGTSILFGSSGGALVTKPSTVSTAGFIAKLSAPTTPPVDTTAISVITMTTARSGGNVLKDGGAAVTARGVVWSTSPSPTIALSTKTSDGSGTGSFTSVLTGLTAGTTYYVRAYATNSLGTSYGPELGFTTLLTPTTPTVNTTAVSAITDTTANSGGDIISDGEDPVTARGVVWDTSSDPTVALETKTNDGSGSGSFTSSLTGLTPGTTYYARAYATNSVGTSYGSELTFTTLTTPTISTTSVSAIANAAANSGGIISADGGAAVTARGVVWDTSPSPTIVLSTRTSNGSGTGSFTSALTGLVPGTLYYVRAYATNSVGTSYGSELIFTTFTTPPVSQWLQWIDGNSSIDELSSVITDSSGNVYICGTSNNIDTIILFGDIAAYTKPSTVSTAAFIGKLDSSGIPQWLQWIDGGGSEFGYSVAIDPSGNIYLCGRSGTTGTSIQIGSTTYTKQGTVGLAAFIAKLDSYGVGQWLRWIDGTSTETGYSVTTDFSGNVYVCGNSDSTGTSIGFVGTTYAKPATTGVAAFIGKLDSSGVAQWLQWIDGGGAEEGRSVTTDFSGNIYVCGYSNTSGTIILFGSSSGAFIAKPDTTSQAAFIGKLDSAGNTQWLQWIDGTGTTEQARSVTTDSSGNVYVCGQSDTSGTSIRFGDIAEYTKPATAGVFGFIAKIDSFGVAQWLQWIGGPARSVSTDSSGNVYVSGFSGTTGTSILFGSMTYAKPGTTSQAGFIGKLDTSGTPQWLQWIDGGGNIEQALSVATDSSGNVYVGGLSNTAGTSIRFGEIAAYTKPSTVGAGIFIAKLSPPTAPPVDTTAVSVITMTTARSGGNVLTEGGATVTTRGVVWDTSPSPTIGLETKTNDGSGTGSFTSVLTGLTAGTTYYVRAYAINIVGTSYGPELTFTTLLTPTTPTVSTAAVSAITDTTANCGSSIISDGEDPVTARGVVWDTSSGPTIALSTKTSDNIDGTVVTGRYIRLTRTANSIATGGQAQVINLGEIEVYDQDGVKMTGLSASASSIYTVGGTYPPANLIDGNLNTFASTNEDGIGNTWVQIDLGSNRAIGQILVYNRADCCQNRATGLTLTISTTAGVSVYTAPTINTVESIYIFQSTSVLTGLVAGTTYYVRAYATNSVGTSYGSELSFTTLTTPPVPQWLQWIDGGGTEEAWSVTTDSSGNVYVCGYSNTSGTSILFGTSGTYAKPGTTSEAAFIGKLDSSGVAQWLQWIDGTGTTERGYSVTTDSSENVYVCGYSNTSGTSILFGSSGTYAKPGTTSQAAFIGKLNSSGTPQWLQWIDGTGTAEQAWSVTTDSSGNVYVCGYSNTTGTSILFGSSGASFAKPATTGNAAFIGKLNSFGVPQWLQWIDGGGVDVGNSVATDSSGNVYVTGYSTTSGTSILFGSSGSTYTKPGTTSEAAFIGKLDSSGVPQWLQWIDGGGIEDGRSVVIDSLGNVYICGYSTTTGTSIWFGDTAYTKPSTASQAAFIGQLDSSGVPQWLQWIDGTGTTEQTWSVTTDSSGNVYVSGYSNTTGTSILFGSSGSTFTKPGTTGNAGFIAKLSPPATAPPVSTTVVSVITMTTARSGGNVLKDGGAAVTARGVVWNTSPSPTVALSTKTSDGSGTGSFTSVLTGLTAGITYYMRSYATNIFGTSYGPELTFTTLLTPTTSTVNTTAISAITDTTANSGGDIISDGDDPVTARGVVWDTSPSPTIALSTKTSDGSGTGSFSSVLTGLTAGITYYIRAYATNSVGTSYGSELTFTTLTAPLIPQWLQWIDGGGNEVARSVTTDSSGNVYVCGYSDTTGTSILFSGTSYTKPSTTSQAAFIGKLNSSGTPQWLQWIDGEGTAEQAWSVTTDSSGNVYVCGYSNTTGTSILFGSSGTYAKPGTTSEAAFIGKLNSSGMPQWLQWIDGTGTTEQARSVTTDFSGNVYVCGFSTTSETSIRFGNNSTYAKPSTANQAIFIAKLDSSGNSHWLHWIDGIAATEQGYSVAIDSSGNVYVCGQSNTTGTSILFGYNAAYTKPETTGLASFIGKLNSFGVPQWLQWIDGAGPNESANSVTTDSSGNVYVCGRSNTTGTSILFGDIAAYTKPTTTGQAAYIGKLDSSGVPQWLQWIDGVNTEIGYSVATDSSGNVYVCGFSDTTETSIRFGDNAAYTKPSTTGQAIFIGQLSSSGVPQWLQWIDGTGTTEEGRSVATDSSGNVYVCGFSNTTGTSIRFGEIAEYTKPDTTSITGFIAKLSPPTTATTPTISTTAVSAITATTARSGGNVLADGGAAVTARGVVWDTLPSPTIALSTKTSDGSGTGSFTSDLTGLTAETTYYVRAYATNSVGTSYGSELSFTTPTAGTVPDPPTGVTAIAENAQATVSFVAPVSDGGAAITSYTVTSSPGGFTATGSASPITVTGLTNGTAYTFTVTATNSFGTGPASSPSAAVTPGFTPGAPTSVTAVAGNAQATVSFTAPVSDGGAAITSYTVTSSPGGFTATGGASPITVTGLTNGTAYTFTVSATNSAGTGPQSDPSSPVTPATVPSAPTAVAAVATGNGQATVGFTASSDNGGSAIISYTVTSSPHGVTATGTESPIVVNGLVGGAVYTFRVVANNAVGASDPSGSSTAVLVRSVPSAPTGITLLATIDTITVSFSPPSSDGGDPITSYTVTANPGGIAVIGTGSPITVEGLVAGTLYTFNVAATNGIGTGVAATAGPLSPGVVPDAPTVLGAVAANRQVTISFSPPPSDGGLPVLEYRVYAAPGGFTASGSASPITVSGLTNGTQYAFTVYAVNAAGTGAPSNTIVATPLWVPDAPQNVVATAGIGQATISFDAPPSDGGMPVVSYTVIASPGGAAAVGTFSPITVTGLQNGTTYTFRVRAMNAIGVGPASASSNEVIPLSLPSAPVGLRAVSGYRSIRLVFGAPLQTGGLPILSYTAVSVSGGLQVTGSASPLIFTDLDEQRQYSFTVYATNSLGNGPVAGPTVPTGTSVRTLYTIPELIEYNEIITVGEEFHVRTDRGDFASQMLEPVSGTASMTFDEGVVTAIAITGIPDTAVKVTIGALPVLASSSIYIFFELFDPDGYPIGSFDPPLMVFVETEALRSRIVRTINMQTEYSGGTATSIEPARYMFATSDPEEIQLLDGYVNGHARRSILTDTQMDITVEPMVDGTFDK